jgi:glyoxylase-like metal-dependent hydrolase (beta-lactamase superfamily II)
MGAARADLRFVDLPAPTEGQTIDIAPGIRWLRFALPFRLKHINVWLVEDHDGLFVVDAGVANDQTKAQWDATADRLGLARVERIIATHHHPDHCGVVGWLSRRFDAPVAMSRSEWLLGQYYMHEDTPAVRAVNDRFYRGAGLSTEFFDTQNIPFTSIAADFPGWFQPLRNGQPTRPGSDWTVMTFGGHAPEHVCLYSAARKILIAGDQVLPAISPIIAVAPHEPDDDPLDDFLRSLEALRRLPPDILVLPSHGQPFRALHTRIDALVAHHDRRLRELSEILSAPADGAALTTKLFPDVGPGFDRIFALGETVAHLRCLEARGEVRRRTDADGIDIYERAG